MAIVCLRFSCLFFSFFEYFPLVISMRSFSVAVCFYLELFSCSVVASVDSMTLNRFSFVFTVLFPVESFDFLLACLGLSLLCCRLSSNVC